MKTYSVIEKATGREVYQYNAEEPVEWNGMELATHAHVEYAPVPLSGTQGPRRLTKLQFTDRMGDAAYAAILETARTIPQVEVFVDRFRNATIEPDGTSIYLDDPRTIGGVQAIGAALFRMDIVSADWVDEVLNG